MEKLASLEILSNIKGADSSESIEKLFDTVRNATVVEQKNDLFSNNVVTVDDLREDLVEEASSEEKQIIINNFPNQKNNYLLVPKVIEE